jgi:hypothetical protein
MIRFKKRNKVLKNIKIGILVAVTRNLYININQ